MTNQCYQVPIVYNLIIVMLLLLISFKISIHLQVRLHFFSDGGSSNQIDTSLFKSIDQHQSFDFWEDDSSGRFDNDDESDEGTENTVINSQLAEWAIKFNISLAALSALLIILRLHNLSLPKDPRTLLSTPFNFVVQNISEGTFCYRGIQKGINSILRSVTTYH